MQNKNNKPKALIVISSAKTLPLSEPKNHNGIATGFFLVELAKILQTFEDTHEFIFVTPDGKPPQLDINGFALSFHAMNKMGSSMTGTMIDQMFNFSADNFRNKRPKLVARREQELNILYKYLGKITVSEPLPNTDKEVKDFYPALLKTLSKLPEHNFLSINELLDKNRDINDSFKLKDLSFVHLPGGHGPMVDFHENPYMGELLNTLRENNTLISLICHGPVALTSTKYRVSENGEVAITDNNNFKGAKITVLSAFSEQIGLKMAYTKIPGKKTRLEYIVEDVLKKDGYLVKTKLDPTAVHVVYDQKFNLLTGNGPQAMDAQAKILQEIIFN